MIKRYRHLGAVILVKTQVGSNTAGSGTATTQNYSTIIAGEPGAVVGFKVTLYSHTAGGANYTVDGTTYILNNTFTRTLDGTGHITLAQFIDIGTITPGNAISVQLSITSTSIGVVSPSFYFTDLTLTN